MSDRNDELWDIADVREPRAHTTPEDWVGIPDPVQSFGSTVERALQQLAREFAGIRAERDGLRLELEGVRAQLELVRAQLAERERFAATVRELGDIVRQLNVPPDWQTAPLDPPPSPDLTATAVQPVAPEHTEPTEPWAPPDSTESTEPPPKRRPKRRRGRLRKTLTGVATVLAALIVVGVLLVSVGPKVAPYHTYFVRSGSMEPTFDTGDLIVLGKVQLSKVEKGDIITFERPDDPDTLVTHRVVGIETTAGGKQFRTKGDANDAADPWRVPATGSGWRYKFRISKVGYVFGSLSTPVARIALLAVPVVLLGLVYFGDVRKRRAKAAPATSE